MYVNDVIPSRLLKSHKTLEGVEINFKKENG